MEEEIKNRDDFYSSEINTKRAYSALMELIKKCSLSEILWIARNVSHDMIDYYDEDTKGIIFNGQYTQEQIEEATVLQEKISESIDFFTQIVLNKNTFDQKYLYERIGERSTVYAMRQQIESLEKKVAELTEELDN